MQLRTTAVKLGNEHLKYIELKCIQLALLKKQTKKNCTVKRKLLYT